VIDAHVHITENGKWFDTNHNASLDYLIELLERNAIEKAVILPIAPFISNSFIARACREYPNKLIGFASVNVFSDNADEQLEKAVKKYGLKGLKLHPKLQVFQLCDPRVILVLRKAAELRIPIIIDTWIKEDLSHRNLINCVRHIATQYPSIKIILAHLGGPNLNNIYQVIEKDNIYFDLSFILTRLDQKIVHKRLSFFLKNAGSHRLIYGSDFPEINLETYFKHALKALESTNITSKEMELILSENMYSLFA